MNLFDISQEYMTVLEMAEDPNIDPQTITDTMEAIEADFEDKLDSIAYICSQLDGDIATLKKERDRIDALISSLGNNKERLKKYTESVMRLTGNLKVKTKRHTMWIQKNTPSLKIDNAEKIPAEYLIPQDPKVDGDGIRKALKEGAEYDWCHLEQTESLRIR